MKIPKIGTKSTLFGYFWARILKNYCHIRNQDLSSIGIEVIRTVYYYFFYQYILHKKTHKLYSNILIHLKSIIKNTSNFHSDAKQ